MFEKTFHYCAVGLAHVGIDGTFIRVNKKLCEFLDYSDQELTKLTFQDLTAPDHLDEDLDQLERLLEGQIDNYSIEKRYIRRDGKRVWAKLTVSLVRDDSNNPDYFISVVEDIDEKKRIQSELFQVDALFSKIVSAFSERTFIWVATPDFSKLKYANDGYANIFGRSEYELYCNPMSFLDHVHEDDRTRVAKVFSRRPLENWDIQYRIYDSKGEVKYLHDRGNLIFDDRETQTLILGTADDITREKNQQQALMSAVTKLEHLSQTDSLTGLANRREILSQLSDEIARMERGQKASTLVYVDLNKFKEINDKYGHKVGDNALVEFSQQMKSMLRDSDRFGRIGGDEFVILLYGTDDKETEIFFERIAQHDFTLNVNNTSVVPITFSVGWVTWSAEISSVEEWLDKADEVMYEKKHNLQGQVVIDKAM
ncbi:diguanylate cyclase [Alteromonas mediterranea]|uniref:Diguanylate cyclase n=1 Tax=Alteromonas mediterranea TaxID=314275 RepID=A0AAC8XIY9_9ALTE|nr:diguanylate cyclase [Alteromonas mediterranea]AFV85108.1 putative diguanylate cyclase/phosphodiesterase/response regulator [Alteromonas mediterranea DE1]AGP97119.1 diguanylate cyclase/phosphodiesterase/response regulator [Alteromonas mediterranea UM7]AGQ01463.1 diguanylate cyclase/phosphodiesterase/response regulator [Alteromonas mediterranea UM4b]AMJ78215.1 diguanylate cyclase [Alteromonas mediterranea]AMJ82364.1 diguanylate cyclase [Alteromonas mediterranea]